MNKIAKSDLKNIGQMAKERASRSEIAQVYGVTAPAISYVLKQIGQAAIPGTRGRRAKGYSLAQSPSPTLRRIAREKGLIPSADGDTGTRVAAARTAVKPATKTPATGAASGASVSRRAPHTAPQDSSKDSSAKPWEYHGIYDPEKGRIITPSELKKSVARNIGGERQPKSAGGTGRKTGGRKKAAGKQKSKPAIGEVPETTPGSGTEEPKGGTAGAEIAVSVIETTGPSVESIPDTEIADEIAETATTEPHLAPTDVSQPQQIETTQASAESESAPATAGPQINPDGDLVVPEFLKPSKPAEGSRPRVSRSMILVGGHGRGVREVQVSRISRPGVKKNAVSGVVARHFSNVALIVQRDLVDAASKLEQSTRDLLTATKGSVSPKHLYRSEIASRVKAVTEIVDKIEISLLQL